MTPIQIEAEALFHRYLRCWNGRDLVGVAACFAEPAMFITDNGTVALPDRQAVVTLLERVFAELDAAGFSRTTIGPVRALACGDALAVVDAQDVRRLKGDGSVLETLDGHYVMRLTDDGWRFAVAMACEPGWRTG
jgi:uncharacterized protein (TIGR02246 family)